MQTLNIKEVCQVRVNCRNFGFTQTWENNTKSPCANQKRNVSPLFWVDLNFEWYEYVMVVCVFIVIIFVYHLDENDFRHCYGSFFRK